MGAAAAPGVYFPLTINSYWTFNDAFAVNPGDTLKRTNTQSGAIGTTTYTEQEETDNSGTAVFATYNRKDASGNYYEFAEVHNYALLTFDDPVPQGEILFLKDVLTTNQTWLSAEYTGTENGVAKKLRYSFTCTDNNATVTVGTKTFNNVYKVTFKPQVSTSGGAFTDEPLAWEVWYAKNIGMVYTKIVFGANTLEYKIRFWQIF